MWRVVTAVKNAPRLAIGPPIVLGLKHFKNVIIAASNVVQRSRVVSCAAKTRQLTQLHNVLLRQWLV